MQEVSLHVEQQSVPGPWIWRPTSSQAKQVWTFLLLPADALGVLRAQSKRGGRVQLHTLLPPETEYGDGDKGEALYASELALSLEKLNFTVRVYVHAPAWHKIYMQKKR